MCSRDMEYLPDGIYGSVFTMINFLFNQSTIEIDTLSKIKGKKISWKTAHVMNIVYFFKKKSIYIKHK